jgi:coproporphyrinogen III oxidase-like Fe-S oxidoreductase
VVDRSRAQHNPGRPLDDVLAGGDVSAWLGLWPERLPFEDVLDAWDRALRGPLAVARPVEVYAHFAFCRSSCHFCQYWHVVPRDGAEVDAFVERSVVTLRRYRERLGRVTAAHAYFGGGTPTALSAPQLARFLEAFGETFRVEGDFTCEGHPATLDEDKIALLARAGVNRLSMGVQSLDPAVLKAIGRVNPPLPRIAALVACAQRLGISVNLDLVLGLPEQSPASFRHDLEALLPARADSVIVYRYLPVERLPHEIPASMRYSAIVGASIVRAALARGYLPSLPRGDEDTGFGLRRPTARVLRSLGPWIAGRVARLAGAPGVSEYTLGEASDVHLLGLGPGAISHVFGWAWLRDATAIGVARGDGEPQLVGTRLSPGDELRTALLLALRRGGWTSLSALARRTGVDPREALGAELDAAAASGALRRFADWIRVDPRAPAAAALRRSLVPSRPEGPERRRRALEVIDLKAAGRVDPRLVELDAALRETARDVGPKEVSGALRAWCDLVGALGAGATVCDAKVERVDAREVCFRVIARPAPPLRVSVREAGAGPSFGTTSRFAISYAGGDGRALAPEERRFLERLLDRTRDAERTIVP